jgi:hypothetical protein
MIIEVATTPRPRVCDFCCSDQATWDFPCRDFMHPVGAMSKGSWAACDECKTAVEEKRYVELANAAARRATVRFPDASVLVQYNILFYMGFDKNRLGPPISILG